MSEDKYQKILGITLPEKCLLCRINVPSERGHFHPRLVSRYLQQYRNTKFRFSLKPSDRPQDTVKLVAFCDACEDLFGESEGLFSQKMLRKYFKGRDALLPYEGFLYRFSLSVLWRALALTSISNDRRFWTQRVEALFETWRTAILSPSGIQQQPLFIATERNVADEQMRGLELSRESITSTIAQGISQRHGLSVYVQLGPFHFFGWDAKDGTGRKAHLQPFRVHQIEGDVDTRLRIPSELLRAMATEHAIHGAQFRRHSALAAALNNSDNHLG